MANIAEYLRKILEARYGRDVRGSIHDAISAINDEAVEAVNNSSASAQSAQLSAESANKASSDVAVIKTDIYDTAIPAINQAVSDSQAAQMAAETAKEGAETARTDTEALEALCKIYKDKCENATAGITGGLIPQGTTEYANLPSLEDASVGWLYYISDDFVTTSEFIEGEGFYYPPGTNAYVISVEGVKYWDCMGGEMAGYLMKADFDSTLADAKPEFEEATELKVSSGITSVKNLFANVAKIIKVLGSTDLSKVGDDISSIIKALSDKIGSTDISDVGDGSVTGAVSTLNSNLSDFQFRKEGDTAQYSTDGETWTNFRNPTGNVGTGDVLSGKIFANSNSDSLTGTMPDNGAWTASPTASGSVSIPEGYHNGEGYVDTSAVYTTGYNAGKAASSVDTSKINSSSLQWEVDDESNIHFVITAYVFKGVLYFHILGTKYGEVYRDSEYKKSITYG